MRSQGREESGMGDKQRRVKRGRRTDSEQVEGTRMGTRIGDENGDGGGGMGWGIGETRANEETRNVGNAVL